MFCVYILKIILSADMRIRAWQWYEIN